MLKLTRRTLLGFTGLALSGPILVSCATQPPQGRSKTTPTVNPSDDALASAIAIEQQLAGWASETNSLVTPPNSVLATRLSELATMHQAHSDFLTQHSTALSTVTMAPSVSASPGSSEVFSQKLVELEAQASANLLNLAVTEGLSDWAKLMLVSLSGAAAITSLGGAVPLKPTSNPPLAYPDGSLDLETNLQTLLSQLNAYLYGLVTGLGILTKTTEGFKAGIVREATVRQQRDELLQTLADKGLSGVASYAAYELPGELTDEGAITQCWAAQEQNVLDAWCPAVAAMNDMDEMSYGIGQMANSGAFIYSLGKTLTWWPGWQ